MARKLLASVFGRASNPSPEVKAAVAELKQLAQDRPNLANASALLSDFLPALFDTPILDQVRPFSAEQAAVKLAAGLPLLRGEAVTIHVQSFQQRWLNLCAITEKHQESTDSKHLADAMRLGNLPVSELVADLLAGRTEAIHARAAALGLNVELAASIIRLTCFPILTQFDSALMPLRQGVPYTQGYCPTCGGWPLLGEFRGLEQIRFLRCGFCAAAWEFPRLRCPFCGTSDHEQLGYFHVEGEETKSRAATCEHCRGYVKMLATLSALTAPELLVADLSTIHLDLAAAERNYAVTGYATHSVD